MAYRIVYSPEAVEHLRGLQARQREIIIDSVTNQLQYQPNVLTKKRKLMRPNPLAQWELRLGDIRVYYQIEEEPEPVVNIRAIGVKVHNRVFIAGEEVQL